MLTSTHIVPLVFYMYVCAKSNQYKFDQIYRKILPPSQITCHLAFLDIFLLLCIMLDM
jgi:hypothetical protein